MSGVTVCIITYNRAALLQESIRSVFDNETRPIEIVVSDNAFSEESAAAVSALEPPAGIVVRHVANPGASVPSQNVMNAFREARHERVVFMHDDDFMMPGGVDALARAWDAAEEDVDAVYGRQHIARADGTIDEAETLFWDAKFYKNVGFGPQDSALWAAIAQQFPCNGFMVRRSLALSVGYPGENEVGYGPNDYHFGVRYALASTRPFVLIDFFVSAYRLSALSLLRSPYENRIYDGHLSYHHLERTQTRTEREREAKAVMMGRIAPLAVAGYLKAGDPRTAWTVFARNRRRMEKNALAKLGLVALIALDRIGFGTIDRHSVRIRKLYDYFYHPRA